MDAATQAQLFAYLASLPPDPIWAQGGPDNRPVLDQSPEWKAFLNALGLEKKQFASDIARREALAKQAAQFQTESLKPQYTEQRRNVTGNAETRGVTRSGAFQRNLAVSRANEGRQTSGIQMALQASLGDLESQLASKNLQLDSTQMQQRASMLAGGYRAEGAPALTGSGQPYVAPVKKTTGNPELDAYLGSLPPAKPSTGNPELDRYLASL